MNNICDYIVNQNYSLKEALGAIEIALEKGGHSREVRGDLGELAVSYTLLALQERFPETKLFQSTLLKKKDGSGWSTEIDFIYVTPFAVFVVEAKSFYGKTIIDKDQKFVVKAGKKVNTYEVLAQNQGHCRVLYEYIYDLIKDAKQIMPVVVIFSVGETKDERSREDRNAYPVLNVSNMYNYIYNGLVNGKTATVDVPSVIRRIQDSDTYSAENMAKHVAMIKETFG